MCREVELGSRARPFEPAMRKFTTLTADDKVALAARLNPKCTEEFCSERIGTDAVACSGMLASLDGIGAGTILIEYPHGSLVVTHELRKEPSQGANC